MFYFIEKETGLYKGETEKLNHYMGGCEVFNLDFSEQDLIILKNGGKFNFETGKVEETEESQAKMLEIEKQADIENAKAYYIENRNLKLKHIMAGELSDGTPEAEAEIEKIRNKIIADYDARQEVMKQKAIDFKNKYGEDLYTYIISDITI